MAQKEKKVREHTRRLKNGRVVKVRQHTAKYDAAEEEAKAASKKKGAGREFEEAKKKKVETPFGFSAEDYKEWYHWDTEDDPDNEAALRVEKELKERMGAKAYKQYYDQMVDSYSKGGHDKAYKSLVASYQTETKQTEVKSDVTPKKEKNSKSDGGSKKGVESTKKKIPNLIDDPKNPWYEFENNFEEGWADDPDVYCLANFPHHREVANLAAHNLSKEYDGNTFFNLKDCDAIAQKAYNEAAKKLYPKEKLWQGTESENPAFWEERAASKKPAKELEKTKGKTPTLSSLKKEGWSVVRPGALRVGGYNQTYAVSPDGKMMYKLSQKGIEKGAEAVPTTKKVLAAFERDKERERKMMAKRSEGSPTDATIRRQTRTINQMRDTANQMEASMNKAAQKKAIKSMLDKGYTKHTTEGEVWFFKPSKEGSYNGSYKVMDDKGAVKTASPSSKEGFKKRIAGKLGIKYKPKNYK